MYYYPDLPFTFKRPVIKYMNTDAGIFMDAGTTVSSYRWSNGAGTRLLKITDPGKYFVYVPYGDGGYICSEVWICEKKDAEMECKPLRP